MNIKYLHIEKKRIKDYVFKHEYLILYKKEQIGEIIFIKKKRIIVIGYLHIFHQFRKNGYGDLVVQYLLTHYKIDCIIGETLPTARKFWKKCIEKYNGQRKNVSYYENCTSSFVIPKYAISREKIFNLLEYTANEV